ncbi:MAG TPA: ABC transporter permease [Saprospiraceae bacterium]|nr:ABC transporter permease [Saprospiraceae bacterium]HMQ83161.1 ABC transporter permease [Saprospiraceae bacterium]
MIQNYLKVAIRHLLKQKGLAAINVLGLSIGLACFSLFLLYALNEFSYDSFHANGDRIFRVYRWVENINGRDAEGDAYLPMPLAPALKADLADVEEAIRWRGAWDDSFVRVANKVSRTGVSFADPQVFQFFSFPMKYGDAATALKDPRQVVLTEETARFLFGESNPTGKTLEIQVEDHFEPFTVSAVAENLPPNSSLHFQIVGSFDYYAGTRHGLQSADNWGRSFLATYVRLREGSGLANNAETLLAFRKKYYPDEEARLREMGYWKEDGAPITYRLQPLTEIHTDTSLYGGDIPAIEPKSIWMLLLIAAGVLLIACINFTTLAIGRSAGRAREVGVRKVMGSERKHLIGQFLTEAMLLAVISSGIGLVLLQVLLPFFNEVADRDLVFSSALFTEYGGLLLGLTLLVGLLAGSYPALMLSGFKPIEVLKSKIKLGGANLFTKSLVTGQFVISVGLIISTFVILKQLHFMRSQNPGFTKENVVVVDAEGVDSEALLPRFRQVLQTIPQVKGVAAAELGLGEGMGWSRSGWDDNGIHREVFEFFIDAHYLDVLGMELLVGRNFDPAKVADTINSIIINETMMKQFGWTLETALDQPLNGYYEDPETPLPRVIGVVKDFHFRPFKEAVEPQLFHQFSDYSPYKFFVRIEAGNPTPVLATLQKAWESIEPVYPFKYSFLDEDLNRFYHAESRLGRIIAWAGGVAVFLACLGLFGLAALAAANRTKEIGIRKVLGATTAGIVGLLSKDFLKLVALALVIASPLAYYFMERWLQDFAYRVEIQWWIFALAGVVAIGVAFLTVSFQSVWAALANPVESLKNE